MVVSFRLPEISEISFQHKPINRTHFLQGLSFMHKNALKISTALIALAWAQHASATGYHFGTQSVSAQSTSNAATAEASDASTIFYNPAGLTQLENNQITGTLDFVLPHIDYHEAQAQHWTGQTVEGSDKGKITHGMTIAPHLYGAYKITDKTTVGLGVYVPFGSDSEDSHESVLRYSMNQLGLTTIAVEPVVAVKATEKHSFGAGLIAQYSQAKLRKYADIGASRGLPGKADAYGEVKGDDWGFGFQLAWMYNINDRWRVGVNYRSKVKHNLKGTAEWKAGSPQAEMLQNMALQNPITGETGLPVAGYLKREGASVKIVTPESLSLHGMFKATDKLNLFGDFTWTKHSRFDIADLVYENPKAVSATGNLSKTTRITPNWRNTYKVGLGASYQINDPWQIRAGIAYDKAPIRDSATRLNTLPDGDRIWFSIGTRYTPAKNHTIDLAYSFVHIANTMVEAEGAPRDATGTALSIVDSKGPIKATFNNYANIIGLQYTYKF